MRAGPGEEPAAPGSRPGGDPQSLRRAIRAQYRGFMEDLKPLASTWRSGWWRPGRQDRRHRRLWQGAIVGEAGELEHGALWHVPGGYAMREVLGGAKAIVASTKKVGGIGSRLDVPLTRYINASYVRSHFDAMEVGERRAPRRRDRPGIGDDDWRPGACRVGGLKASEIRERTVCDEAKIRKIVTVVEDTHSEMAAPSIPPTRRAAAIAVIENPFAGRYAGTLSELIDIGAELGQLLGERASSRRWASIPPRRRATAKAAAVGGERRTGAYRGLCTVSSAHPCARSWQGAPRSSRPPKKRGRPGVALIFPSGTRMPLSCAAISTDGGPDQRRAARQRNHGGGGGDGFRATFAAWSAVSPGDQIKGKTASDELATDRSGRSSCGGRSIAARLCAGGAGRFCDPAPGDAAPHPTLFAAAMSDELTPTQFAALVKLKAEGPCSQNRLGRLTAMDAATIKRASSTA